MLKKSKTIAAVAILMGGIFMVACTNESKEKITPDTSAVGCDTSGVTYTNYVKSVMDASCATSGCHDAGTKSDGYDFSSYEGAKAAATAMEQNKSVMLGAINHESGFTEMPENAAKLSDCTIDKIAAWVNDGTPQ
jgi:cytochrome c553